MKIAISFYDIERMIQRISAEKYIDVPRKQPVSQPTESVSEPPRSQTDTILADIINQTDEDIEEKIKNAVKNPTNVEEYENMKAGLVKPVL